MKSPKAFHVMAKPTGSVCNLECAYCFYLKKEKLYPGDTFRMSEEIMESYIKQTIEAQQVPHVTIAWQGGEPTLMGLDFFKRAINVEKKYLKPGVQIENTFQTNGTLLNDAWCQFFHDNNFLVGISLDGPREMHNAYRYDKKGQPVFDKVVHAVNLLKKHNVEFNILCTVNAVNSKYPLKIYKFFRDELKVNYLQFIPIVERDNETGFQEGSNVTDRTVQPRQYGQFLIDIFDEWVRRDVGEMFVLIFDGVLASYVRGYSSLCIFRPICGDGVALEHNGDVYSCDHYVEPNYLLGNIQRVPLTELVGSETQRNFGLNKSRNLPQFCKECKFLFTCFGECPKNRVLTSPDGEPGLNWLCEGLKEFFTHTEKQMTIMANLLRQGKPASDIMHILNKNEGENQSKSKKIGRNDPCYCGSGLKYKKCHGRHQS